MMRHQLPLPLRPQMAQLLQLLRLLQLRAHLWWSMANQFVVWAQQL
jgi:acetolactate synthase regulatory subunit